jgi:hypothetical protein
MDDPDLCCTELVAAVCDAVAAATRLEPVGSVDDVPDRDAALSYEQVRERLTGLPVGYYHEFGDHCLDVAEEPIPSIGDVLDDLADIYLDLSRGLAHWAAHERDQAAWCWRESFRTHWQYHAAGAIYAMTWAGRRP